MNPVRILFPEEQELLYKIGMQKGNSDLHVETCCLDRDGIKFFWALADDRFSFNQTSIQRVALQGRDGDGVVAGDVSERLDMCFAVLEGDSEMADSHTRRVLYRT
jgi:hypothetical protein